MDEYHKIVKVNDQDVYAFIDLGSDVNTIQESAACALQLSTQPCSLKLKGFGEGGCDALGKIICVLQVDDVRERVELIIVPDLAQESDVIVGRSLLDLPNVTVLKQGRTLKIFNQVASEIQENQTGTESVVQVNNVETELWKPIKSDEVQVGSGVTSGEVQSLHRLISEYRKCFAQNIAECGTVKDFELKIELLSKEVISCRPYRLSWGQRKLVQEKISEMLKAGINANSNSEYPSPIFLVKKANGEDRPLVDDQLDRLAGNRYFTTLDCANGYFQTQVCRKGI